MDEETTPQQVLGERLLQRVIASGNQEVAARAESEIVDCSNGDVAYLASPFRPRPLEDASLAGAEHLDHAAPGAGNQAQCDRPPRRGEVDDRDVGLRVAVAAGRVGTLCLDRLRHPLPGVRSPEQSQAGTADNPRLADEYPDLVASVRATSAERILLKQWHAGRGLRHGATDCAVDGIGANRPSLIVCDDLQNDGAHAVGLPARNE